MSEIALAAGFGSIRRFNDALSATYGRPPTALRRGGTVESAAHVTLKLPFSSPYDWPAMMGFLRLRAIPGVEEVTEDCYRRTFALDVPRSPMHEGEDPGEGVVEVRLANLIEVRGQRRQLDIGNNTAVLRAIAARAIELLNR